MFPVGIGEAFIVKVSNYDGGAIVDEVHKDAGPKGTRVVKHIAQDEAEEHARQESIELEVDEREDEGGEPDGQVGIASSREGLLQHAAESQFLAYSGDEGDDQKVAQEAPDGVDLKHAFRKIASSIFQHLE